MTGAPLALSDREGLTPLGYALPQSGAVPGLTERIVELLRVDAGDFVIDLCSSGGLPSRTIPEELRRRTGITGASPFGERVARLVSTSGVRTVQMSELVFGRFPMRYEKVLLRGGFSGLRDRGAPLLSELFERLDPKARVLVVDSAPTRDAPLFADALRRWKREQCPAKAIARIVHEAGFATEMAVVECVRHVPTSDCRAWIASRSWPLLETFDDEELERGLFELGRRYGSQPTVTFTSRFELVLGAKPGTVAGGA
jgi:hypothetical protein